MIYKLFCINLKLKELIKNGSYVSQSKIARRILLHVVKNII